MTNQKLDIGFSLLKITTEQFATGTDQVLNTQESVKFVSDKEEHSLVVNQIANQSVKFTLKSNPVVFILGVGESKKFNLDFDNYYDLYVKLNSITKSNINVTVKHINEEIIPATPATPDSATGAAVIEQANETKKIAESIQTGIKTQNILGWMIFIVILVAIVLFYIIKVFVPKISMMKMLGRAKPADAFVSLEREFRDAILKKDYNRARIIYSKINHLYEHMNHEEKRNVEEKIRIMKRELKI